MGLSAELLAEEPEHAILRLQRQRTTKMILAGATVVALIAAALFMMTVAYHDRPEAAQQMQHNLAR
jgi:hypothetical protein